ncbi:MAG: site-specific integrase [Pasteurella sp.]|nr:site-specific integrase [Pasteurella sp.]
MNSIKYAHDRRRDERLKINRDISNKTINIIEENFKKKEWDINDTDDLVKLYDNIYYELDLKFTNLRSNYLACRAFSKYIEKYNHVHNKNLEVPVIPYIKIKDKLIIGADFIKHGQTVANTIPKIVKHVNQSDKKFSPQWGNKLVELSIYSTIIHGGLTDVDLLVQFYKWLISDRKLQNIETNGKPMLFAQISIANKKYGVRNKNTSTLCKNINYILDDLTACCVKAINKLTNFKEERELAQVIQAISKELNLGIKKKPNQSNIASCDLIKYSAYHLLNTHKSTISPILLQVLQGKLKTCSLTLKQLEHYKKPSFNKKPRVVEWRDLYEIDFRSTVNAKEYDELTQEFRRKVHCAINLKQNRSQVIQNLEILLREYNQPNVERLFKWLIYLLKRGTKNEPKGRLIEVKTVKEYFGSFGALWLSETDGVTEADFSDWDANDYQRVIDSILEDKKIKHIEIRDEKETPNSPPSDEDINDIDDFIGNHQFLTTSKNNNLMEEQKKELPESTFTIGRLLDFHSFLVNEYDAPALEYKRNYQESVKAQVISPTVFNEIKGYIKTFNMEEHRRNLCLLIFILAYRTGMRISEIRGIMVKDFENPDEQPTFIIQRNKARSLKTDNAQRRIPLYCLLHEDEMQIFQKVFYQQQQANRDFLFSTGAGKSPLSKDFLYKLFNVTLNNLLKNNKFTYHSFRHTAISHLALVMAESEFTKVFTDYNEEQCKTIINILSGCNEEQGRWVALASFAGHGEPIVTFKYYIHFAHLIAGEAVSKVEITLPFNLLNKLTEITYDSINDADKTAYNKDVVPLYKIKNRIIRGLAYKTIISDSITSKLPVLPEIPKQEQDNSIFIPIHYEKVREIASVLQKDDTEAERHAKIQYIADTSGIDSKIISTIHEKLWNLYTNKQVKLTEVSTFENRLNKAMETAYKISCTEGEKLIDFVNIFIKRVNRKNPPYFGKKDHNEIKKFLDIGTKLVPIHKNWTLIAKTEEDITDLKKKIGLPKPKSPSKNILFKPEKGLSGYRVSLTFNGRANGELKYLGILLYLMINDAYMK